MKLTKQDIAAIFSPPAEPTGSRETGLTFTDILFGFVLMELFVRLAHTDSLPKFAFLQLITATLLVLGSWIGFRRSLTRPSYELKFVNLPLVTFVLDQAMVVLYFHVAILTPEPWSAKAPGPLAHATIRALFAIFCLYLVWDAVGGIWMGLASKYPKHKASWGGPLITVLALLGSAALFFIPNYSQMRGPQADLILAEAAALLFVYRFLKEIRTTWNLRHNPKPGDAAQEPSDSTRAQVIPAEPDG